MQTIKGMYNCAHVMIDAIDDTVRRQIQGFVNDPSFHSSYIAIMPDCHAGAGSCIGFTMPMNDRIIPDVVGVDIGCGLLSCKFDLTSLDLPSFDAFIKQHVPSRFHIHNTPYSGADFFSKIARKIGMDPDRALRSVGTLGGGNHFIEAGYGTDGKLWVTVHSGSRNFGLQIATYHGKVANRQCAKRRGTEVGIPFLDVDSPEGQEYLADQRVASEYAGLNRQMVMNKLERFLKTAPVDSVESRHNFIDETGMIRKGATPALKGQRLIIPFNMRDGLAFCIGKGNTKFNCSAPHGAGRILSRTKAKKVLDVETFRREMKRAGIFTTTANKGTLDESPDAYKDKEIILRHIAETVDLVEFVKPVYNFKACGD